MWNKSNKAKERKTTEGSIMRVRGRKNKESIIEGKYN